MILNRREFADRYGVGVTAISVYVKRGKLIQGEDGIDIDDTTNALFIAKLEKRKARQQPAELTTSKEAIPPTSNDEKPEKSPAIPEKKSKKPPRDPRLDERFDLENLKKRAESDRILHDITLAKMKIAKQTGQVIPTDAVRALFSRHFKSVMTGYKNAAEQLIIEFGKRARLSLNDIAELRLSLTQSINRAVDESIAESKQDVRNLIAEHSQQKAA